MLYLPVTGRKASITITRGAILRFIAPQGRHVPPIVSRFGTTGKQQSPTPCLTSGGSVHIQGFLTQKNFKNPKFCKLICPIGANPSIDIHEIYKFYVPMGSTKMFPFGVIRCLTEGVMGRKTTIGNFHQIFWSPGC